MIAHHHHHYRKLLLYTIRHLIQAFDWHHEPVALNGVMTAKAHYRCVAELYAIISFIQSNVRLLSSTGSFL